MSDGTVGVAIMAYGTPRSIDEIEAYYTDIRRGRPPSAEQLADLTARYEAIGGLSPLTERTEAQGYAIAVALDDLAPGRYQVFGAFKHTAPSIEEAAEHFAAAGVDRIVGLVLAPHYSAMSVGQYLGRLRAAASRHDIEVIGIESWASQPEYVDFLAADLTTRLARLPDRTRVVFTAHSLPKRILDDDDPYADEVRITATAVADAAALPTESSWMTAWQSAGRTDDEWLEPDILDVIDQLADDDIAGVLVCACGFVADHLEVLYDLDIAARQRADAVGLAFDRTACINDDPNVMRALATRVHAAASAAG